MLCSAVQCILGHNNSIKIINRKFMSLIFIGSVYIRTFMHVYIYKYAVMVKMLCSEIEHIYITVWESMAIKLRWV